MRVKCYFGLFLKEMELNCLEEGLRFPKDIVGDSGEEALRILKDLERAHRQDRGGTW